LKFTLDNFFASENSFSGNLPSTQSSVTVKALIKALSSLFIGALSKLRYIYYRLKLQFAKISSLSSVLPMSLRTQALLKLHIFINNCVESRNCILGLTLTQGTGFFLQIWHFVVSPELRIWTGLFGLLVIIVWESLPRI
jgi:hypothetical protein